MEADKKQYIVPEFLVVSISQEFSVCSALGTIIATDEESDGNEWPSIN